MTAHKFPTTQNIWFFAIFIVVVAVAAGIIFFIMPSTQDDPIVYAPGSQQNTIAPNVGVDLPLQDLNGKWIADMETSTVMTATVKNNTIEIMMENGNVSATYWVGSFPNSANIGDVVTSNKLDVPRAVMSTAANKDFVIGNDIMTFEMSAMGVTRKLELSRAE